MTIHDIGDWVVKALAGLPVGLIAKYAFDVVKSRKTRGARRIEDADADVEEAVRQDKIKSSSITTLEAQMVAERNSWASERDAKDRTIDFLREQNGNLQHELRDRDAVISDLRGKLADLQRQLDEVVSQIDSVQSHDGQ